LPERLAGDRKGTAKDKRRRRYFKRGKRKPDQPER